MAALWPPCALLLFSALTAAAGRTIAVFGSGVSGLSAAHKLNERGFDVTVYEREHFYGGKTSQVHNKNDWPLEVNNRAYGKYYIHLNKLLEQFGDKLQALQHVELVYMVDASFQNYIIFEIMSDLANAQVHQPLRPDLLRLRRAIVNAAEHDYQNGKGLSTISYAAFVRRAGVNSETLGFLRRAWSNFWAASLETNADVMTLHPDATQTLPEYAAMSQTNMFAGAAGQRLIEPWVDFLRAKGVKFHSGVGVESFEFDNVSKVVSSATLTSGADIEADGFVLAVGAFHASKLLPWLEESTFAASQRWTITMHWHLLQGHAWPSCLQLGRFVLTEVDYNCVYVAHDRTHGWAGRVAWPDNINGTLVVTCMASEGLLMQDFAAVQQGFLRHTCINPASAIEGGIVYAGMHPAYSYGYANGTQLNETASTIVPASKLPGYHGPLQPNGMRWSMHHPLFVPTQQEQRVPSETQYSNLALAGEYIEAEWIRLPTIEQASETGYKAAHVLAQALLPLEERQSHAEAGPRPFELPERHNLDYDNLCSDCYHDFNSSACRRQITSFCVTGGASFLSCLEFMRFVGDHPWERHFPDDPFLLFTRRHCGSTFGVYFEYSSCITFYSGVAFFSWFIVLNVCKLLFGGRLRRIHADKPELVPLKLVNIATYIAELVVMTIGLVKILPLYHPPTTYGPIADDTPTPHGVMERQSAYAMAIMEVSFMIQCVYTLELLVKRYNVTIFLHHTILILLAFLLTFKDALTTGDVDIQGAFIDAGFACAMCGLTQHGIFLVLLLHELRESRPWLTTLLSGLNWGVRVFSWCYGLASGLRYVYVFSVGHTVEQRFTEMVYYWVMFGVWCASMTVNVQLEYAASIMIWQIGNKQASRVKKSE